MLITEAIDLYLSDSMMQRRADKTRQTYTVGMNKWRTWAAESGRVLNLTDTTSLTAEDMMSFVKWMSEQGLSAASIRLYITAVMGFYRYLIAHKLTAIEFADWTQLGLRLDEWRKVLKIDRFPRLPDESSAQRVFAEAEHPVIMASHSIAQRQRNNLIALRNDALLEAYRATAARCHELCKLKRNDLDIERHHAVVKGKGGKTRTLYFDDAAWSTLMAYLHQRDEWLGAGTNGEPLFMRHDRKSAGQRLHMTTNGVRENLNRICQMAGVDRITPHQYRHRAATILLEKTGDITLVQKFLGHADVSTTQIYAHVADQKLQDALNKTKL